MKEEELKKIQADTERIKKACVHWTQSAEEGHHRFIFGVQCDCAFNDGKTEINAVCVYPESEGDELDEAINAIANVINHNSKFRRIMCTAVDWWREAQKPQW